MNSSNTIQKALKSAAEQTCGEVEFYNAYSGRGMYGRKCVGLTGSEREIARCVAEVIKDAYNDEDMDGGNVVDILLDSSRDSMGLNVIVYWEDLEASDEESQEEDGETRED